MATKKVNPEVLALQQQLLQMQEQLSKLTGTEIVQEKEYERLHDDDYVKVISLCDNILNLNTSNDRNRSSYRFGKFGDVIRIPFGDLNKIMQNCRNFFDQGLFSILDPVAVHALGVDEYSTRILDKTKIERILAGNETDAVNLFKSASERQRETIINLILDKMMKGESFDLNLLDRLSRVIGPEYSIANRFKQMKEANNPAPEVKK